MAVIVPETLASHSGATWGEKRVFELLKAALQPDENYFVWYEPKALNRYPDFLVWSQHRGLLVIEVKDWGLEMIVAVDLDSWTIKRVGVDPQKCLSPTEQARKCAMGFMDLFKANPDLCHQDGPFQGRPKFPIGFCAIFTTITGQEARSNFANAIRSDLCLFADDLRFDPDDPVERTEFSRKLEKAFVPFPFKFAPLNSNEFNLLRSLVFPEVQIHGGRRLRSSMDAEIVRILDFEQEKTAKGIPSGHRVLKGVAGSGKTLVVTCRAKFLKQLHSEWRILIVCFTQPFRQYLLQLMNMSEAEMLASGIHVFHYHKLLNNLARSVRPNVWKDSFDEWNAETEAIVRSGIAAGTIKQRYDAILIDECQDLEPEWVQILTALLNEETDSLLICIDPAQNIFGRQLTYKSLGIKVQGKKPVLLGTSYRNTVEILNLARRILQSTRESEEATSANQELDFELFPRSTERHGQEPIVVKGLNNEQQAKFIIDRILQHVGAKECSWGDIGVLYPGGECQEFTDKLVSGFTSIVGQSQLCWVSENRSSKSSFDFFSDTVKLMTIESAKGLGFPLVFLIGLDGLPRAARIEASERRLAYVGITRAEDLLYVIGNTENGFFKEVCSDNSVLPMGHSLAETTVDA